MVSGIPHNPQPIFWTVRAPYAAVGRTQAKIIHRYISGYFREVPLLKPLVARETDDGIELAENAGIVVATNSYRAVRGCTNPVRDVRRSQFLAQRRLGKSRSGDLQRRPARPGDAARELALQASGVRPATDLFRRFPAARRIRLLH